MICIGYAGYEAFDVVLYISRTLTKLKRRVLIVDFSESYALTKSLNHGMGLDSREEIINFRNVNYTRKNPTETELVDFRNGVVFVVYGKNFFNGGTSSFPLSCEMMNIVVNTFPHMIDEINSLVLKKVGRNEEKVKLLIRDIITRDDVDRVTRMLSLPIKIKKINYLYLEIADSESAIECQRTQIIKFSNITSHMQSYIIEQIQDICPNEKHSKIKKAIIAARNGN